MARILREEAAVAASAPPAPGGRRIAAEVHEAAERARAILAAAEEEARRIVAGAEAEREKARAQGAAAGREEGLAAVAALLARAAAERDRRLAEAPREIVRLAVAVAGRILGRAAVEDAAGVEALAARALQAARQRREVVLRVHPDDAAALRSAQPRLAGLLARAPCLELRPDAAVERGGVVVETEAGTIDARLTTQLAALGRALEGEVGP